MSVMVIIMVKTSVQCMSVELCSRRSQICWGEIVCELEHGTIYGNWKRCK